MAAEKLVTSIEDKLWAAADKLRGSIDASKYKNIVLGIVFLKYISDRFEHRYIELIAEPSSVVKLLVDMIEPFDGAF